MPLSGGKDEKWYHESGKHKIFPKFITITENIESILVLLLFFVYLFNFGYFLPFGSTIKIALSIFIYVIVSTKSSLKISKYKMHKFICKTKIICLIFY